MASPAWTPSTCATLTQLEALGVDFNDELLTLSEKHPGSWLAFLGSDLVYNGAANGGVQKKYRPRAYDEGPKSE